MWNLLNYIPDTLAKCRYRGFFNECPRKVFVQELKRATGVLNDRTVNKWLKQLVELGYIHFKTSEILQLCLDFERPYEFDAIKEAPTDLEKDIKKNIKDLDKEIDKLKSAKPVKTEK